MWTELYPWNREQPSSLINSHLSNNIQLWNKSLRKYSFLKQKPFYHFDHESETLHFWPFSDPKNRCKSKFFDIVLQPSPEEKEAFWGEQTSFLNIKWEDFFLQNPRKLFPKLFFLLLEIFSYLRHRFFIVLPDNLLKVY